LIFRSTIILFASSLLNLRGEFEPFSLSQPFLLVTQEARIDTDFDGIPDDYERFAGTDLFRNDAHEDLDGDGATNLAEYNAGTHPGVFDNVRGFAAESSPFRTDTRNIVADSDGDGLPDWWESAFAFPIGSHGPSDDPDGDGIENQMEFQNGTNPLEIENYSAMQAVSPAFPVLTRVHAFHLSRDLDLDGMPDWWELRYGMDPAVPDGEKDLDGDGLSALAEFMAGRNPNQDDLLTEVEAASGNFGLLTGIVRVDTDGDGIPDDWERKFGLNPEVADAQHDPDGDGWTNIDEYNAGTDPYRSDDFRFAIQAGDSFRLDTGGSQVSYWSDTDLDGMLDWWELRYGLDPTRNDGTGNPDGDLYTNLEEFRFGTNPRLYDSQRAEDLESNLFSVNTGGMFLDSDQDGLPDSWERLHFGDLRHSGSDDFDADGMSNYAEFRAGTDPTNPNSRLYGTVRLNGESAVIEWASVRGKRYRVYAISSLQAPKRRTLIGEVNAVSETQVFIVNVSERESFFQLEVE
jgi:hypothetical protein